MTANHKIFRCKDFVTVFAKTICKTINIAKNLTNAQSIFRKNGVIATMPLNTKFANGCAKTQ